MKYEPFSLYMRFLLMEHDSSHSDLSRRTGLGRAMLTSMINGRTLPALTAIPLIADALMLEPSERDRLILLAHLAHSTPMIQSRFERYRIELKRLRARLPSVEPALPVPDPCLA